MNAHDNHEFTVLKINWATTNYEYLVGTEQVANGHANVDLRYCKECDMQYAWDWHMMAEPFKIPLELYIQI